mgnify:CR=1 FL=1
MDQDRKNHWETVYKTKNPEEVSWTQNVPQTSLNFIHSFGLDKTSTIIDVGGGDSKLVDFLLDEGFENITVLDISGKAIERAKKRLGDKALKVHWIECDITDFEPEETYDVWHDRAAFHFLTSSDQIEKYKALTMKAVKGYMVLGTFSENGPKNVVVLISNSTMKRKWKPRSMVSIKSNARRRTIPLHLEPRRISSFAVLKESRIN